VLAKWILRVLAASYLTVILAGPLGYVFYRTFKHGFGPFWDAITQPLAVDALKLTLIVTLWAVPLNAIFGIICAMWIVRRPSNVTALVSAFVDLPLALSPVVVGLALLLLYGRGGWFGDWMIEHGHQVAFATPGIVLATIFVSLPFVVREVVPVLREIGNEQEQAAWTLGASSFGTFRRITFPAIRPALVYGVVLTAARCLGEFGAVSVISGRIQGQTDTLTLYVQDRFDSFDLTGAYATSVLLAMIAILTLVLANLRKPALRRQGETTP
jgi:sulfate/thiosulfate transport system permease protein